MIDTRSRCAALLRRWAGGRDTLHWFSLPRGTHSFVTTWSDLGVDPLPPHSGSLNIEPAGDPFDRRVVLSGQE